MSSNATLARKVAARKRFLNKVLESVTELVVKYGEVTKYREHSCHTHIVRKLNGFGGYSFELETGQTMMGGNTLKIIREHPDTRLIFDVYWQIDHEKCEIVTFIEEKGWKRAILRTIRDPEKIAASNARRIAREKKANEQRSEARRRQTELSAEAKRLGVQ